MEKKSASPVNRYESNSYRNYVLGLLTFVYAVNFIDRQLLTILQESIKADLALSDTQLGLLTGLAFALFYVLAGIPIARLADKHSRRNIIAGSIGIWSFMTAISGMAGNYTQLLLARMGVGIGEAGCSPPAHSMISDMYPPEQRASALSFYSVGINIGIMLGVLLGGYINQYFGWRVAFFVVGAPGLLIALIVRFTIAEPLRGWSEKHEVVQDALPFMTVLRFITARRYLVHMAMGGGLSALAGYALTSWQPSFYIRDFGLPTSEVGLWLAAGVGLFGGLGTFGWGYLCDRVGQRDKRWYLWLPAFAMLVAIIPIVITFSSSTPQHFALIAGLFPGIFTTSYMGASLAVLHGAVEPRMRATASALFFLVLNIIGLGCGPTLVGAVSDYLAPTQGVSALGNAVLYVVPIACLWAAVHFFLAAHHMHKSALSEER